MLRCRTLRSVILQYISYIQILHLVLHCGLGISQIYSEIFLLHVAFTYRSTHQFRAVVSCFHNKLYFCAVLHYTGSMHVFVRCITSQQLLCFGMSYNAATCSVELRYAVLYFIIQYCVMLLCGRLLTPPQQHVVVQYNDGVVRFYSFNLLQLC